VWLASQGWSVTGVDFSDVGVAKAADLAAERGVQTAVRWVTADATTWQPDDAYDLVVVFYLQLPAAGRRAAMAVATRALAPGGTMLVVAHDSENLVAGVGGPPDPAVLYSANDVVDDVMASGVDGIEVQRAGQVLRPVEVTGEAGEPVQRNAIDCLVRLVRTPS
jgi:ubiquinone/menaquinone biosynthesis C-methylase UbiE